MASVSTHPAFVPDARKFEPRQHGAGRLLYGLYRFHRWQRRIAKVVLRLEGGTMFSVTWRRILADYHDVHVGRLSYGPPILDGSLPAGSRIGSFCSLAPGLQVLRRNHPLGRPSQHPLFYNRGIGALTQDSIPDVRSNPLVIGHDVWIGVDAVICPGCRSIGDGAIVAAGAVVTKDVPPCAIVGGNPARVLRKRFAPEIEAAVLASGWWEAPLAGILSNMPLFLEDLTPDNLRRFLDAFPRPTTTTPAIPGDRR